MRKLERVVIASTPPPKEDQLAPTEGDAGGEGEAKGEEGAGEEGKEGGEENAEGKEAAAGDEDAGEGEGGPVLLLEEEEEEEGQEAAVVEEVEPALLEEGYVVRIITIMRAPIYAQPSASSSILFHPLSPLLSPPTSHRHTYESTSLVRTTIGVQCAPNRSASSGSGRPPRSWRLSSALTPPQRIRSTSSPPRSTRRRYLAAFLYPSIHPLINPFKSFN